MKMIRKVVILKILIWIIIGFSPIRTPFPNMITIIPTIKETVTFQLSEISIITFKFWSTISPKIFTIP